MKQLKNNLCFIFLFLYSVCFSQDIHFSQFYAAPLVLNPANTGNFDGDWRIINNYRNQWKAIPVPFNTFGFGIDKNIMVKEKKFGAGLQIVYDQSAGLLSLSKIFLSGNYKINISENIFSLGLQAGLAIRSFSFGNLTFPDQYDSNIGYFNPQLNNNDPTLQQNLLYFDLNTGILWSRKINRIEPEAGYTICHLNNPKETFLPGTNRLPARHILNAGIKITLNYQWYVIPRCMYMFQKNATDLLAGGNVYYIIPNLNIVANTVFAGAYFRGGYKRNSDAMILVAGAKIQNFEAGISYDINVSDLSKATKNRGAFEISLIYIIGQDILKNRSIPCDRL